MKNATSRAGRNGVYKSVQMQAASNLKKDIAPVKLTQQQIDDLLKHLPANANQARRFVTYVAKNPNSKTALCNVATLGVNLSDIARKYNPYLLNGRYVLRCHLPERLILNKLREPTMQHLWGLFAVSGGMDE